MEGFDYPFWGGFFAAIGIGFLSNFVRGSWVRIQNTHKRMFVNPPKPVPKNLSGAGNQGVSGLGIDPGQSPLAVLSGGCLLIIGNGIFSGLIMGVVGVIIGWIFSLPEIPPDAWNGVMFAGLVGFVFQFVRYNWKKIGNLYGQMVNPPVSTTLDFEPPNQRVLGARPAAPAFTVVLDNSIEIALRFFLIGVLIVGLIFLTYWLFSSSVVEPLTREFGV